MALNTYPDGLVVLQSTPSSYVTRVQKKHGLHNLRGMLFQGQADYVETATDIDPGRVLLVHSSELRNFILFISVDRGENPSEKLLKVGERAYEYALKTVRLPPSIHAGMLFAFEGLFDQSRI